MKIQPKPEKDEVRVTIKQVLSWEPCEEYTRKRIEELFAGRETVTAPDILSMDIPARDRLWAVLREELVPANTLHEFACQCAEAALMRERKAGREPDPRSWAAIDAKRAWLRGEIDGKALAAARYAAARKVREAAAWDAAAVAQETAVEAAAEQIAILRYLLRSSGRAAPEQIAILRYLLRSSGQAAPGKNKRKISTGGRS